MLTQEKLDFSTRNGMIISSFHLDDKIPSLDFYPNNIFLERLKNATYKAFKASITENSLLEIAQELMAVLHHRVLGEKNIIFQTSPAKNKLCIEKIITLSSVIILKICFFQKYDNISVYGARVTLEIDEDNQLLAINSAIGVDIVVDSHPTIKSGNLNSLIESQTGRDLNDSHITSAPYYYFDIKNNYWRLVYFVENKLKDATKFCGLDKIQERVDYVIDAHSGDIVSQIPRFTTTFPLF